MNGTIDKIHIGDYKCIIHLPESYSSGNTFYPVVYINGGKDIEEVMCNIESHFQVDCEEFIAVSIQSTDWNRDFSPWPAPRLSAKREPFEGKGLDYIENITRKIKPYVDTNYRTFPEPKKSSLVGYSLGGLMALYTAYITGVFGKIGSLSGSLWYDGWTEFISKHQIVNKASKVYLSLGKSEEKSRNKRMAKVEECTRKTVEIIEKQLSTSENIKLEWNDGGHFFEVNERFVKGLLWLMKL